MSIEDFITKFIDADLGDRAALASGQNGAQFSNLVTFFDDDLLATLLADYKRAKSTYNKVNDEHGADAAMAELAHEIVETARACVETRLHELRTKYPEKFKKLYAIRAKGLYGQRGLNDNGLDNEDQIFDENLDKVIRLTELRERENARRRERDEKKRKKEKEISDHIFVAFFLLTWLIKPFEPINKSFKIAGMGWGFVDIGPSFRKVATLDRDQAA